MDSSPVPAFFSKVVVAEIETALGYVFDLGKPEIPASGVIALR